MATPKRTDHLFKKGYSGNPAGRPKGVGYVTQFRKNILDRMPEIIDAMIEKALEGDAQAARLLIDRVIPVLKPQAQTVSLPVGGTLAEQSGEVLHAVLSGQIPADIAAQLSAVLSQHTKIVEHDELRERVEALENSKADSRVSILAMLNDEDN